MQPSNTELILIRVTGEDRPGLTASVTEILAKYDATILDIGQADIHNTLSLGILFKSEERHSGFIMKELLFKASSLGVTIRFEPITTEQYENWVGMQGKNRYILTVLGRKLSARQISAATSILAEQDMNIDAIKRLTGRIPLDECQADARTRACIEFSVRGTPKDRIAMQEKLMKFNIQEILFRCLVHWPWFVFSVIVCIACAWGYLRLTTPVYNISATVLIKDDKKGGGTSMSSELERMGLDGFVSSSSNVDNEIEVLRSKSLSGEVVDNLGLFVTYIDEDEFPKKELYQTSPILVSLTPQEADKL